MELLRKPHSFALLTLIAIRTKRFEDGDLSVRIGEAMIGDYEAAGIQSRSQYRCAKDALEKMGVCSFQNRQKFGVRGTVARILDGRIWEIFYSLEPAKTECAQKSNSHRYSHQSTATNAATDTATKEEIAEIKEKRSAAALAGESEIKEAAAAFSPHEICRRFKDLNDDDFLEALREEPVFEGIDVDSVHKKLHQWARKKGEIPSRYQLVYWLNTERKPVETQPKQQNTGGKNGELCFKQTEW